MRCPNCNAENDGKAKTCAACGTALKRRRARKRDDEDAVVSPQTEAYNREVLSLYKWCLLALIPVAGLVLGPLVAWRAHRFSKKAATDPMLAGAIPVGLAFWMGVMSGVLSWVGVALMALGLWMG
jgi:uncharacterized Tic20 family protein